MKTIKMYTKWIALALAGSLFGVCMSCSDPLYKLPDIQAAGADITEFNLANLLCTIDDETGVITIDVTPDFDMNLLKNLVPTTFKLSPYAIISPDRSVSQDFSKDVQYTVTAEDGTQKVWTVKTSKYVTLSQGVGYSRLMWYKTQAELGLTANAENTVATFGDYIVVSRTGLIFDATTGESAGLLNQTGIPGSGAQAVFVLTNDDEGNLIGATLTGWSGKLYVYKWTALDQNPIQIVEYTPQTGEAFARKIHVSGNINGNAYIVIDNYTAYRNDEMYCWKVTGGTVNQTPEILKTDLQLYSQTGYSLAFPKSGTALLPYYYYDTGTTANENPSTVLKYVDENNHATVINPYGGWGGRIYHALYFPFNHIDCLTVLSLTSDNKYRFFVVDPTDLSAPAVRFSYDMPYNYAVEGTNGNNTAGIAVKRISDDVVYVYVLMTSKGMACYMVTDYTLAEE